MNNQSTPHIAPQQGLEFKGVWNIQLFNSETGELELDHTQNNIIVNNAITHMATGPGPTSFNVLQLSTQNDPNIPSILDNGLQGSPIYTSPPLTVLPLITPGNFTYQLKASLGTADAVTTNNGSGALTEAGLFTPSGIMFNHILFNPPIVKTNLQTAFITTTITLRRV
jgi:hypothetical protein